MNTPPATQSTGRSWTGAYSQQSTLGSIATPHRQPTEAFSKALASFRTRLSAEELASFKSTTYENLVDDLVRLQQQQEKKKEMMNLSRIQAFLEGMNQLGKIVEVYLNVNEVVCFVWGPVKFLLLTASAFSDTFDTLLDAYAKIGEQLPLLLDYEELFGDSPHMIDALQLIYIDILTFHKHALRFFQGSKLKHIFRAMWKSYETEFRGIIQSLERHKGLVDSRGGVDHFRRHKEDMAILKAQLEETINGEKLKKLIAIREWLGVGEAPNDDHTQYQAIRCDYKTTTRWIIDREIVKKWIEDPVPTSPVIWMHGIPGAGKTILASAVIDKCKQQPDFLTGYFYCHDGDQNANSAISILKGLADQLLAQYTDLLLPSFHNRRTLSGDASLRSVHIARKLLEDCCSIVPKLFLVVDGLDECEGPERKDILESLTQLAGECNNLEPGKLRILVMSQYYPDIQKALQSSATTKLAPTIIAILDKDNEDDIKTYVKIWVDKIATKNTSQEKPFSDDMKEYLRNLTLANAKGMFLYAKLVLENLFNLNTRETVIDSIRHENFPRGLEQAYERIVRRIKDESLQTGDWKVTKKLLGWMVCAKRQLTWREMQVALSIDPEYQTIEYDDRHLRAHIHDICGSLVLMIGDRVTLVHSTAKTYMTRITKDINEPSIECELAILCMQYLTFPCFQTQEKEDEKELRKLMLEGHFAFQDYAVAKWFHHVNAFVKSSRRFLDEANDKEDHLDTLCSALEDFTERYDEVDWEAGRLEACVSDCSAFVDHALHENLLLLTSHIYTFQKKGFEARHKISIKSLEVALERNRKLLEELPAKLDKHEMAAYCQFYDEKKKYKCTKITCRYFSQGFSDAKAKKRHINIHERPFQCEVSDCLGAEGYANEKDLRNHTRAFHPEASDLAETFISSTAKRGKSDHACSYCGKTFTRNFHLKNHEASHRGERPFECPECGKAFTRANDCKRHQKLHERGK